MPPANWFASTAATTTAWKGRSFLHTVIVLPDSLAAWGSGDFASVLKREVIALGAEQLPLAQGLARGGMVDAENLDASVLAFHETDAGLVVKLGLFYAEVIGGCNCNDDPVGCSAYGVVRVTLDRTTGIAEIVPDGD